MASVMPAEMIIVKSESAMNQNIYYTIEYHGQRFKCYIESVNALSYLPPLSRDIDGNITRMRVKTRYKFTLVKV